MAKRELAAALVLAVFQGCSPESATTTAAPASSPAATTTGAAGAPALPTAQSQQPPAVTTSPGLAPGAAPATPPPSSTLTPPTTGAMTTTPPPAAAGEAETPPTAAMMEPAETLPPAGGSMTPTIPPIEGECPEFRSGSNIAVAGHGSIAIQAGAPGGGGPLLFYWHGTGGSSSEVRRIPQSVVSEITSEGGIIASFNGRDSSGADRDCSGTGAHNMADFLAADQIVACAVERHGIDPKRIYSTGCSAGGLQTGCMAVQRSQYIAAVAPNSGGTIGPGRFQGAVPAAFTMHGGSGDNVIVNFGETSQSFGSGVTAAGGTWVDCNHMRGHCGAPGDLYTAAWEFMKAHPYGTQTSPLAGMLPSSYPSYCELK